MAFFDKLGNSIVSAGKDAGQKAKDMSSIAKLKMDIRSKEDYVDKQYATLGKAYYERRKDDTDLGEDSEQFFLIKEALDDIKRMRDEMMTIQGITECPQCGAKLQGDSAFCSKCGAKLDNIFEEE